MTNAAPQEWPPLDPNPDLAAAMGLLDSIAAMCREHPAWVEPDVFSSDDVDTFLHRVLRQHPDLTIRTSYSEAHMTPTEAIDYLVGTLPANPANYQDDEHTRALVALKHLDYRQLEVDPVRREALDMALLHRREGQGPGDVTACAHEYECYLRGSHDPHVPTKAA